MALSKEPYVQIADGFVETMKKIADSHGLRSEPAKVKGMTSWRQYTNTLVLFEGEGDSRKFHWLLYYKVSSAPKPDFWWGLTGKILDMMSDSASECGAQWAVVLLAGNSQCGYLLEAQNVERGRSRWSHTKDDQYKIVAKNLHSSNSRHFNDTTELEGFLQLG